MIKRAVATHKSPDKRHTKPLFTERKLLLTIKAYSIIIKKVMKATKDIFIVKNLTLVLEGKKGKLKIEKSQKPCKDLILHNKEKS